MSNQVIISKLNPVKFTKVGFTQSAAYNNPHFDDQQYNANIPEFWEQKYYVQKWQTTDAIRLQFISNYSPLQIDIVDCNEVVITSVVMTKKAADENNAGYFIYEADISMTAIPEGSYYLQFAAGADTYRSEPINVKTKHEGTVYIEYKHSSYRMGVIFETDFAPAIRVEGRLGRLEKGAKDQMWEDQTLNQSIIDGKSFRVFPFHIGGTFGIPDWIMDKITDIFGCDAVQIDGKYFTKAEAGAKFEPHEIEGYPLRGFSVDLRESYNRHSIYINPTIDTDKKIIIMGNIETNFFGEFTGGTNQVQIITVE